MKTDIRNTQNLQPEEHVEKEIRQYVENEIIPQYSQFDAAHREDHARMVIGQSMDIAGALDRREDLPYSIDYDMVYVIAAMHDLGLRIDRKTHHLESGRIVREEGKLKNWFSEEQIEVMAQAVEDHRASSDHEPRSIYGKIVAEADRFIVPEKIIERTVQYGLAHYPDLDREGQWLRTLEHLQAKYADGGYLRLWFPESPNHTRLEALRDIIRDENRLREIFNCIYSRLEEDCL